MALTGGFAVVVVILQYCLGPMVIDFAHQDPPGHLRGSWGRISPIGLSKCLQELFESTSLGLEIIEEAAPNAFTYGHGAYDARVVVTRGYRSICSSPEEA